MFLLPIILDYKMSYNYKQWLLEAQKKCKLSGIETTIPLLLLEFITKKDKVFIISHDDCMLEKDEEERLNSLLFRSLNHEPLAYIKEVKEFYGRDFFVDKNVLIPRPETEMLIDLASDFFKKDENASKEKTKYICDIGTGSGCISISALLEIENSLCTAYDISSVALEIAKKNAKNLKVADKIDFKLQGINELYQQIKDDIKENKEVFKYDCILSNPPYIPEHEYRNLEKNVKEYEPLIALTSGNSGLEIIQTLLSFSKYALKSGGILLIEHGYNQAQAVKNLANIQEQKEEKEIWKKECIKDYAGHERIFKAIKI